MTELAALTGSRIWAICARVAEVVGAMIVFLASDHFGHNTVSVSTDDARFSEQDFNL